MFELFPLSLRLTSQDFASCQNHGISEFNAWNNLNDLESHYSKVFHNTFHLHVFEVYLNVCVFEDGLYVLSFYQNFGK